MIQTWNIKKGTGDYDFIKGDTFRSREITFPFDITNVKIEMQFKLKANTQTIFFWSTENNTFEKISTTKVIMKSRPLDFPANTYISDMQLTFANGVVDTAMKVIFKIVQDITT